MIVNDQTGQKVKVNNGLEKYYRFHSKFYDATRWTFLFGRSSIFDLIPELPPKPRILEIGCGTGNNLSRILEKYPESQIIGLDISQSMLEIANRKYDKSSQIKLINGKYPEAMESHPEFDLIICSYSLTMFNTDMEMVFQNLKRNLKSNGILAIVDFHETPFTLFRYWMNLNHVSMDGSILPLAKSYFSPLNIDIKNAYGGIWSYFLMTGRNK